jgi:hypothetical protein
VRASRFKFFGLPNQSGIRSRARVRLIDVSSQGDGLLTVACPQVKQKGGCYAASFVFYATA